MFIIWPRSTEQINTAVTGSNITLSQTEYNEIGQVKAKHLHGPTATATTFFQDIYYKYNERGWLKRINDPAMVPTTSRMFAEQLNYDSVKTVTTTPNFNGNISEQWFQVYNPNPAGLQNVVYGYDPLNRLNSGVSSTGATETGITYDNLGNIASLTRGTNAASTYASPATSCKP